LMMMTMMINKNVPQVSCDLGVARQRGARFTFRERDVRGLEDSLKTL